MRRHRDGRSLDRMHRILIAAAALAMTAAPGGNAAAPARCGPTCVAAYAVIAKALPHDREHLLARTILATPGFDYGELTSALHIPTTTQVRAGWPRFCHSLIPHDGAARARCDELLLTFGVSVQVHPRPPLSVSPGRQPL
jgi:hypothetical protein